MSDRIRILIAEHDTHDLQVIEKELKKGGYTYISEIVKNEQGYINALNNFIPDIILSDYAFPSFSGALAFSLRETIAPDTPFVFVTGTIGEEKSIEFIKIGVTDYVLKDRLFTLNTKIKRALKEAKEKKEKEKSDRALINSEKRFRTLIENSTDMITLSNEFGEMLYGSPSIARVFGYAVEDIPNTFAFDFIHPDDLEEFVETRNELLKMPGKSFHNQLRLKHKNGTWIWCESTLTNLLDEPGIHAMVANFRDISEKKKREDQKEYDSNNLNALINNTNDFMWSVDRDFNLITSNKRFNELVLHMSGEVIAKGNSVFGAGFSKQQLERYKGHYERAFSGESFMDVEYSNSPVEFWSEISYSPIFAGQEIIGAACHSHDITDLKRADKQLRTSEAFNRGVLNSLISHIAVVNKNGEIVAINEAWENFAIENGSSSLIHTSVGCNYFDVCTRSANSGDKIAAKALKGMKDVLENKTNIFSLEYPCHSPSEKRWFLMIVIKFDSDEPMIVVAHQNISVRVLAEQKLLATSGKLQQALGELEKIMVSSLDVICAIDEEGKFVNVSTASESIWGYSPNELKGKKFMDLVFVEDMGKTAQVAEQIMNGLSVTMFENRYVHKNGTLVPLLWSAKWDKKDNLMYCIAKDATEKKRLEKVVELERHRFLDLFTQAPSSIGVLKGPDHIIEMANPLYMELIGKKEIIGRQLQEVLPEITEQGFIKILDDVYKTGNTFSGNEMLVKLDKEGTGVLLDNYLNFIYQAYRNEEGEIEGILFYAIDVTEQVLSRKKIEESEKGLREAQSIAHLGNWEVNFATGVAIWSEEACRIYGISPQECIQSYAVWESFIHPDDLENVLVLIRASQVTLDETVLEHRILLKDGSIKHIYSKSKFDLDINGKPIGLRGISHDVTDRKIAKLKLEKQNKELIKTNAELDRFVYSVSHDLRSPLTAILGLLSFIEEESKEEDTLKHAQMIQERITRLDTFVVNILSYSKNNRTKLKIERVPVHDIVSEIVNALRPGKNANGITFEIDVDDKIAFYSDIFRFNIILENIISNAIKYQKKNIDGRYIKIKGKSEENYFYISVEDNGEGLSSENVEKIFEMFFRVSGKTDGSGIGLYIVKETIEKLQGSVKVESEEGKGTIFILKIKNLMP